MGEGALLFLYWDRNIEPCAGISGRMPEVLVSEPVVSFTMQIFARTMYPYARQNAAR